MCIFMPQWRVTIYMTLLVWEKEKSVKFLFAYSNKCKEVVISSP